MPRDSKPKTVVGVVSSDKMSKTITVVEDRLVLHPVYRKYIHRRTKYTAHDEQNSAHIGDVVRIAATRPLSRMKRWRLVEIVRSGQGQVAGLVEGGKQP